MLIYVYVYIYVYPDQFGLINYMILLKVLNVMIDS